ncbi:MAG TPA: hypothetical protein VNK51_21525, partial [Bradyrhizobium sp.]|nr:hypothetical protein [Bradyrhizobium sp.]
PTGSDDVVHVAIEDLMGRTCQRRSSARGRGLTGDYPPCPHLSRPTLPRPPQARLANMTTSRSPLENEPGCATHTSIPNFGKAEYFRAIRLTEGDTGAIA